MESEFTEKYKSYSNFELLKITHKPDNYQENAVWAANEILKDRIISQADLSAVEDFYSKKYTKKINKTEEIEDIDEKIFDFLYPTEIQSKSKEISKWFYVFLSIILIEYCYQSYYSLQYFFEFIKHDFLKFDIFSIEILFRFLYFPFLFYLIYKKSKLGWILLFLKNSFGIYFILNPFFQIYLMGNQSEQIGNPSQFVFFLIYYIAFNIYLFIPNISNLFGIGSYLKRRIILLTVTFILIYLAVSST